MNKIIKNIIILLSMFSMQASLLWASELSDKNIKKEIISELHKLNSGELKIAVRGTTEDGVGYFEDEKGTQWLFDQKVLPYSVRIAGVQPKDVKKFTVHVYDGTIATVSVKNRSVIILQKKQSSSAVSRFDATRSIYEENISRIAYVNKILDKILFIPGDVFVSEKSKFDEHAKKFYFETIDNEQVLRWYFKMPVGKTKYTVHYIDLLLEGFDEKIVSKFESVYSVKGNYEIYFESDGSYTIQIYSGLNRDGSRKISEQYIITAGGKQSVISTESGADFASGFSDTAGSNFIRFSRMH